MSRISCSDIGISSDESFVFGWGFFVTTVPGIDVDIALEARDVFAPSEVVFVWFSSLAAAEWAIEELPTHDSFLSERWLK
jgi:hypothetical protein